jgi:hypothetical protein
MEFRIWVETRLDGRMLERELVSSVERPASGIGLEEIGLKLEEGKAVLRKVQARIVQTQVDVLSAAVALHSNRFFRTFGAGWAARHDASRCTPVV